MITAECDGCGTTTGVRAPYVTIWNGITIDLCPVCAEPLVPLLDGIYFAAAKRRAAPVNGSHDPG